MPFAFTIDTSRRLVLSRGWGVLNDRELVAHVRALAQDPRFRPDLHQLCDFIDVTDVRVTAAGVREMTGLKPFGAGARRAFAVSSDVAYGMARMYQIMREDAPDEVEVFRDIDAALEWLGVAAAKAELLRTLSELPPLPDTGRGE